MKLIFAIFISFLQVVFLYGQEICEAELIFTTIQKKPHGLVTDGNLFWVAGQIRDTFTSPGLISIHGGCGNLFKTFFPGGDSSINISTLELQGDTLWGVFEQERKLYKMDKMTGSIYNTFDLPTNYPNDPNNYGIVFDGTNLWNIEYNIRFIQNDETSFLYKINPENGALLETIEVPLESLLSIEMINGKMLGISRNLNELYEINLDTGEATYLSDWCLEHSYEMSYHANIGLFGISGDVSSGGTRSVNRIIGLEKTLNLDFLSDKIQQLNIYPNPTTGFIRMNTLLFCEGIVYIFNTLGETLMTERFEGNIFEKNIESLPSGTYYFLLESKDYRLAEKFIKI